MRSLLCVMAAAALTLGTSVAAQQTWTGQISDSHCGTKHTMQGMSDRACTEMCIKNKSQYVFVTDGKVYKIADQTSKDLATHAGHTVMLTGTMNEDTLAVSKIEMPKK
jgi:hypothetical protein